MAENKNVSKLVGLTRGKAALIGVLAIALAGVVYVQYGSSSAEDASTLAESTAPGSPVPRKTVGEPASPIAKQEQSNEDVQATLAAFDQTRWKSPDLSAVIAYDPFALPATFPRQQQGATETGDGDGASDIAVAEENARRLAEAVERLQHDLEALKQRGVHVIMGGRDQYVAVIGDRTLHVGDEINGFIVTAIDPDGVSVEKKGVE